MGKYQKLLPKILSGNSDSNVEFEQLRRLLILVSFSERIKGSHHIFHKENMEEIIKIQENQGKAKTLSGQTSKKPYIEVSITA